ncbi:MAG: AtpZ/AtpI family protein [Archangiaceae bacterium]|nr:AtpZ/AtpI family protein [Archangiaceae bacterium]
MAPVVGVAIGWWVDKKTGSAPVALVIGSLVGMVLGFVGFIVDVTRMSKKEKQNK